MTSKVTGEGDGAAAAAVKKNPELRSCGPLFEIGKICVILNHYQSVTLVMSGEHLTITKVLHL